MCYSIFLGTCQTHLAAGISDFRPSQKTRRNGAPTLGHDDDLTKPATPNQFPERRNSGKMSTKSLGFSAV